MINNSVVVRCIILSVNAASSTCGYIDSYLNTCYQDAWVKRVLAATGGHFRAAIQAMCRQSFIVRIAEQLLGSIAERVKVVLVSSYEGSRVLGALERALANSKLAGFTTGDKTI